MCDNDNSELEEVPAEVDAPDLEVAMEGYSEAPSGNETDNGD